MIKSKYEVFFYPYLIRLISVYPRSILNSGLSRLGYSYILSQFADNLLFEISDIILRKQKNYFQLQKNHVAGIIRLIFINLN